LCGRYAHILVQAKAEGWVGFGLMRNGIEHGMQSTDIYWGGLNASGEFVFYDSYVVFRCATI
jgi:hypothetical protein